MYIVYSSKGEEIAVLTEVEYVGRYMNDRVVNSTLFSDVPIPFEVGNYIMYRGEKYVLYITPTAKKTGKYRYTYTLSFLHESYELYFCMFRDYVPSDNEIIYANHRQVDFTGDVTYLTERIQYNLNKVFPDKWTIDVDKDIDRSLVKNISAQSLNCWNALSLVNTEFEQPFYIKDYTIYVGYDEPVVDGVFLYGKGGGAYDIERISNPSDDIITKLSVTGTSRNLDYTYPKQPEWKDSNLPKSFVLQPLTLMLPDFKKDGKTDFLLASDADIAKYGIRESSIVVDDIYPSIVGSKNNDGKPIDEFVWVKPINEKSPYFEVAINNPDFVDHNGDKADLKELMIPSKSTVVMKSGSLQGFEFNIVQVHEEDRRVRLILARNDKEGKNANTDENFIVPNEDLGVKVGDKFVFIDIYMPQSYIREAEKRLEDRGRKILESMRKPKYIYDITVDHIFMAEKGYYDKIYEGQKLHLKDEGLEADTAITINTLMIKEGRSLIPEYKIVLNDEVKASTKEVLKNQMSKVEAYLNDLKIEDARQISVLTSWDSRTPSEYNVLSAVRTLGAIKESLENQLSSTDNRYLRKDIRDTARKLIVFLDGINVLGLLDAESVRADDISVVEGISTPDFSSGYFGYGWDISKDALDDLYKGEMDELTIRGIFRVYEFVIAQLRAENGTIVTSDAMRVKSIDRYKNIIYLDTEDGILYNPFRKGDIVRAQQFNGTSIKRYTFVVDEAIIGDLDGDEERVDYIKYREFQGNVGQVRERDILNRIDWKPVPDIMYVRSTTSYNNRIYLDSDDDNYLNPYQRGDVLKVEKVVDGEDVEYEFTVANHEAGYSRYIDYIDFKGDINDIKIGDAMRRIDNPSMRSRKGILVQSSSEPGSPFFDVKYGITTDKNPLKARLGRLDGVVDEYLGRLYGYGLYGSNVFLRGNFYLRNGEDVGALLKITKDSIEAESVRVDSLTGRVQKAEIDLRPDNIWMAVKDSTSDAIETSVMSGISIEKNTISIFGKNISLDGVVTFNSLSADAQNKINSAQSAADSANSGLGALKGSLKGLAYEDKVEKAKLGSTVIEGGFLKTELIRANSITADKLNVGSLVARHLKTSDSGARIEAVGAELKIYGTAEHPNIVFGVNKQGYATLAYYSNEGKLVYDLGPRGIDWGSILPAAWTEIKLADTKVRDANADYWDFQFFDNTNYFQGNVYYHYFAGSNPTITQEEKEKERYVYRTKGDFEYKISDGWYIYEGVPEHGFAANTNRWVKPYGERGLYPYSMGVRDIPPIYVRTLILFENGMQVAIKYLCWNGTSEGGGLIDPRD